MFLTENTFAILQQKDKLSKKCDRIEQDELIKKFNEIYTNCLNFTYIFSDNKKIFTILKQISYDSITRQCNICFDDVKITKSIKICINPFCNIFACNSCSDSIFDLRNKIGKNISFARTMCPTCKFPLANTENIPFVPSETLKYTDKYYTAWCQSCRHLKKSDYMKCDDIEEYNIEDFICNDCIGIDEKSKVMYRVKDCPSCHVKISKNLDGSCNHVSCFNCKKHVCFFQDCENFFDKSDECYSHMRSTHGSIYDTRDKKFGPNFFEQLPDAYVSDNRHFVRFQHLINYNNFVPNAHSRSRIIDSGLRLGELEISALLAHGTCQVLSEYPRQNICNSNYYKYTNNYIE